MSEIRKDNRAFIGYEYKELNAAGERAAFCLDCYRCFGWQPDERMGEEGVTGRIVLKRERKIMNRTELTRLQRHYEACMDEITELERSRTSGAAVAALCVGLAGTAFVAGSTFAVTHVPPLIVLSILLALPGLLGWILPWFLYRKLVFRRSKVVAELVEQKYDEIDEICEQGNRLLS